MSNMSSMNRETKKRQLKKQVIDSHTPVPSGAKFTYSRQEKEEEVARKAEKHTKKRRFRTTVFLFVLLLSLCVGGYWYISDYQYTSYEVVWEKPIPSGEGGFVQYEQFGTNVLRYSKDGASYLDASGKPVWSQAYELNNPIASINGDFAVIGDQQGNSIYIFDLAGCQGVATTTLPILRISVSAHGVAAAILEGGTSTDINYYKKDGSLLDSQIRTILREGGDGFLTDLSVSPDGTQLVVADVYLEKGAMKNRAVFYNFSEYGKKYGNRLVAGIGEPFENSMIGRVRFLSETNVCIFADNNISFVSMENVTSPELLESIEITEPVRTVFYSDKYAGVIVTDGNGENDYRMDVYKADGSLVFSEGFKYQYQHAQIDEDKVILYNENSCSVYNMSGKERFAGEFDFPVHEVISGKLPNTLLIIGSDVIKEIKLK